MLVAGNQWDDGGLPLPEDRLQAIAESPEDLAGLRGARQVEPFLGSARREYSSSDPSPARL
jgi:hypothetical protein